MVFPVLPRRGSGRTAERLLQRPAPFMPALNRIPLRLITSWIAQLQTGRSLFGFLSSESCLRRGGHVVPSSSSSAATIFNRALCRSRAAALASGAREKGARSFQRASKPAGGLGFIP